jgi:leader peptidase (prepilin peptidase) / N-methyltransferase
MNYYSLLVFIYVFIMGNIVGSFLNVCIYRIPRGESVVSPPSHCPQCGYKIKWYDNIPLISYFVLLRGKCRKCKNKIPLRYPLVEILTGIIWVIVFAKFGFTIETLKIFMFASVLIVLSYIDINEYILPDRLTFFLVVSGIVLFFIGKNSLESSFLGAAACAFPFLVLYVFGEDVLKKDVMGFGDVKLGAGVGAYLGYSSFYNLYLFLTIAFVMGAIISVLLIVLKIRKREELVPFGPYIALSAFICLIIL